jgi:hypothetical protein
MGKAKNKAKKGERGDLRESQPTLAEVKQHFKGKGGGPEAESHIIDANADRKEDFVWFYSNKSDASKVIERCENDILGYSFLDSGIQLKIARKAFRGLEYAFRKNK